MKLLSINITSANILNSNIELLDNVYLLKVSGKINGVISTQKVYDDAKLEIEKSYSTSITSNKLYISFKDKRKRPNAIDNVENILKYTLKIGDGVGITLSDMNNYTGFKYYGNAYLVDFAYSGITSFDEFKYFTTLTKFGKGDEPFNGFENCESLESIEFPNTITILPNCLTGCSNLKNVKLPDSVTEIRGDLCAYCTSLESITLPETLKTLDLAFNGCSSLKTVTFGDNLEYIGNQAFSNCSNLQSVNFGSGLKTIAYNAFSNCTSLEHLNLPDGLETLGTEWGNGPTTFAKTGLVEITIPSSVKTIGLWVFGWCDNLKEITFNNENLTHIGKYCFYQTKNIERVNVTDLQKWCECEFGDQEANPLYYAHNLYYKGSTSLPQLSANIIKKYAFCNCTSLTSVNLGNTKYIEEDAFIGCTQLRSIMTGNPGSNTFDLVPYIYAMDNNSLLSVSTYGGTYTTTKNWVRAIAQMYQGIDYNHNNKQFFLYLNINNTLTVLQDLLYPEDLDVLLCTQDSVLDDGRIKTHSSLFGGFYIIYDPNKLYYNIENCDDITKRVIAYKIGDKYGILQENIDSLTNMANMFKSTSITSISWINLFTNATNWENIVNSCVNNKEENVVVTVPSTVTSISGAFISTPIKTLVLKGGGPSLKSINQMTRWSDLQELDMSGLDTLNVVYGEYYLGDRATVTKLNVSGLFSTASHTQNYFWGNNSNCLSNATSIIVGPKLFDIATRELNPIINLQLFHYSKLWTNVEELTLLVNSMPNMTSLNRVGTFRLHTNTIDIINSSNLIPIATAKGWTITT